jgi:hypothetical protein
VERNDLRVALLHALGDGATFAMVDRMLAWMSEHHRGILVENIGGLSEVAAMLGRKKQTVCNWISRDTHSCPAPIATIASTKLYDLDQWRVWAAGHPELTKAYETDEVTHGE